MKYSAYKHTFIFDSRDMALTFITTSLIGKRIPLAGIKTANNLTYVSYESVDRISDDEKQDCIFSHHIKRKDYDKPIVKHW